MAETVLNVGHQQNNGPQFDGGQQPEHVLGWIQFNVDYFKTRDGILKLVVMVS